MGGVTTRFALDLNNSLAQVLSDGSSTYLYGLGRVAQQNIVGWQYYQPDALGSVRQLVNAAGTVLQARSYEPFGKLLSTAGNPLTRYSFTGEWTDPTNLIFLRARYYDPATGRFLSKDPVSGLITLPGTLNLYTYAVNNPTRYTDPGGEFIDVALDIAFISFDIYNLVNHWNSGCGDITSDLLALGLDIGGALLPFATGLGMVARFGSKADDLTRVVGRIDDVVKVERHHLLPQQFRAFFERTGLNIEDYAIELPIKQHRLKPSGLHTGVENWNKHWKQFFSRFPNATRFEILAELNRLKGKYKLP